MRFLVMPAAAALVAASACTPANDWRELRPEGSGIVVMFPCKPDRHARTVTLAGRATRMEMLVCGVGGTTFGLSFADIDDPVAVSVAVDELRAAAAENIGATVVSQQEAQVPGMTPNARAVRLRLEGRRPDGTALREETAFFVRGLRVYQATILGPAIAADVQESFFAALRLTS